MQKSNRSDIDRKQWRSLAWDRESWRVAKMFPQHATLVSGSSIACGAAAYFADAPRSGVGLICFGLAWASLKMMRVGYVLATDKQFQNAVEGLCEQKSDDDYQSAAVRGDFALMRKINTRLDHSNNTLIA